MEKKYYSEAAMAIHESAQGLFKAGAISEAEMNDFDKRCLVQEPETVYKTTRPAATPPSVLSTARQSP